MTDTTKYSTNLIASHLLFILSFLKDVSQSCQNCTNPSALHSMLPTDTLASSNMNFHNWRTQTFYQSPEALKSADRLVPESRLPEIDMSCWGFDWTRPSRGRQPPIFAKYNGGFERTQAIFDNWNMDLTVLQMKMCPSYRNSLFGHLVMNYPHVPISIRVW